MSANTDPKPDTLSTEKLASLISRRRTCLAQLRELGRKQSDLIQSGEIHSLLRLLPVKNHVLTGLQAIEQELRPFHEQRPEDRVWPSEQARSACLLETEDCRQLLEEVMAMERDNETKMTIRRDEVAQQLQVAKAAGEARKAYQAHSRTPKPGVGVANFMSENSSHGSGIDLCSNS